MDVTKQKTINTLRMLSADAVQRANSGHPGMPLGAAPMAFELWAEHMKHDPHDPNWVDRDRFVLSAGHGSALLYSMLHLFGYEKADKSEAVSIDDLKRFRQFGSVTAGHPEYGHTAGVEITTGPLGQGVANAVGMAAAEAHLAAVFNRPDFDIVNHYTFALCGDGCLQEGIAYEACSLAGTLKLGKLVLLYDSNDITIEGSTDISFTEDVLKRFEACGWHTAFVGDGNDTAAIGRAIAAAKAVTDKPSIIEIKTKIGFGAPNKQGKASAHGEPLGVDELRLAKQSLGLEPDEHFHVPEDVEAFMTFIKMNAKKKSAQWNERLRQYALKHPELFKQWEIYWSNETPDLLNMSELWDSDGDTATRLSSEKILNLICGTLPNLIGGSADLSPSTKTVMKGLGSFSAKNYGARNLHFGIREHAMSAIANGIAAHGGLRVYVAGFFVFSDYMKPAMRLSAMMGLPVISVLTHDSIGVGEDGPTHQPVEQLAMLRSIPNHTVFRPADTVETSAAWVLALTRQTGPTAIVLTRQTTAALGNTGKEALKGGYILRDCEKETPDIILMASGSEVELICKAKDVLAEKGVAARVVSLPSFEIFEQQTDEYKESVLPKHVTCRLAVEAASPFGWHKYTGLNGGVIAMNTFGASAPAGQLFERFGFTVENVVNKALKIVGR